MQLSNIVGGLRVISKQIGVCVPAFALIAGTVLAGCGANPEESSAADEGPVGETQQRNLTPVPCLTGQNCRFSDSQAMYHFYANTYCWIIDMGQADALAQKSPSDNVYDPVYGLSYHTGGRTYTGRCNYPTGCFRKQSSNPIYFVHGANPDTDPTFNTRIPVGQFCHLVSDDQRNRWCPSKNGGNFINIQRPDSQIDLFQRGPGDPAHYYTSPPAAYPNVADCQG